MDHSLHRPTFKLFNSTQLDYYYYATINIIIIIVSTIIIIQTLLSICI